MRVLLVSGYFAKNIFAHFGIDNQCFYGGKLRTFCTVCDSAIAYHVMTMREFPVNVTVFYEIASCLGMTVRDFPCGTKKFQEKFA